MEVTREAAGLNLRMQQRVDTLRVLVGTGNPLPNLLPAWYVPTGSVAGDPKYHD